METAVLKFKRSETTLLAVVMIIIVSIVHWLICHGIYTLSLSYTASGKFCLLLAIVKSSCHEHSPILCVVSLFHSVTLIDIECLTDVLLSIYSVICL